uniref:Uncharacterized protein n=1 Tax=Panagrolaimus superbus TaxID=310955 RepID=A0A914YL51_9BILA
MTISFWLSLAKFSDLKIKEHVVSIGTPHLNVKVFLHASTGTLSLTLNVFGATIKRIKTSKIFEKEKMWESICLGLRVVDGVAKVLVLFGDHLTCFESPDLPLEFQGEGYTPNVVNFSTTPLEICIGSAIETDFLYEISSIFSFKGLLSPQCVIAFRSLGCEFQCLTECRSGEFYSSFANSMTKNLITDKNCNLLEVWSEPKKFISRLQRSILFVIRVTSAHCYGLSVFQKGIDSERLSHVRENVFCLAMYKDYPIEWHCQIVYRKQETLDISLRAIGSIKLFVFLYALVRIL